MFSIKIILNHLNPKLRLSSIDDSFLDGSYHVILRNRQIIRHNGKCYIWRIR